MQVLNYAADVYSIYGVNALDIWDLPASYFFGMAKQVDAKRRESSKTR